MTWDKEAVYDERIDPLMKQIIEICKAEKIPMFATFQLTDDADEPMFCTTNIPQKGMAQAFHRFIHQFNRPVVAITTRSTKDAS